MGNTAQTEMEFAVLLAAAVAGEATPGEWQQLNDLLAADPRMVALAVDLMAQENWLGWHSDQSRYGELRPEILELISEVAASAPSEDSSIENIGAMLELTMPEDVEGTLSSCVLENGSLQPTSIYPSLSTSRSFVVPLIATIGFLLGLVVANYLLPQGAGDPQLARKEPASSDLDSYVGRLVNDTACLWNLDNRPTVGVGSTLRAGESLSLLEGLAEVKLEWSSGDASLKIEGPAGLVLTAERGASLSHGKLIADVRMTRVSEGKFTLNTPNGVIEISKSASLGVVVAANSVEVHLFRGQAKLLTPWARESQNLESLLVQEGESLNLTSDGFGSYRQLKSVAAPATFAAKMSMGGDLPITEKYVKAVLADKPLLYWRFEELTDGFVKDETGTGFHGRTVGEADPTANPGNRSLQLGHRPSNRAFSSYLISEKAIERDFDKGYALEIWLKPSHFHWGSIVSMLAPPKQPGWRSDQGLLLEIGGPYAGKPDIERPGRFRYLHRSPPSNRQELGTSIFTDAVYSLRKWQHVVAVKDGSQLLLYVDGKLVSTGSDETNLASGMKLLVGQLDEQQFYRGFIGQLDELAFYPHALTEGQVRKHYRLVRPEWNKPAASKKERDPESVI